ncbi:MAG: helix-turn-helix domain-containing protein [Pseudonocardiaceae bacterium]
MVVGKTPPPLHQQLGRELARARNLAGIEQRDIAARIGITQTMASRAERGRKLLSLPQIRAWAQACDAAPETLERLLALTDSAFTYTESWGELFTESSQLQDAVRADEATVGTLLSYTRTVVPGLLQTPAYAESVLRLTDFAGDTDVAAALAGRWRRQEALSDRNRHFEFMIAEAVLRWAPYGRVEVLLAQLDHLAAVAEQRENVLLGILPSGSEPVLPFHDFTIYDDRGDDDPLVVTELAHSYMTIQRPRDVALYREIFGRLTPVALTAQNASALIRRLMGELQ